MFQTLKAFLPTDGVATEVHIQQDNVRLECRHEIFDTIGGYCYFYFFRIRFQQKVEGKKYILIIIYY